MEKLCFLHFSKMLKGVLTFNLFQNGTEKWHEIGPCESEGHSKQ